MLLDLCVPPGQKTRDLPGAVHILDRMISRDVEISGWQIVAECARWDTVGGRFFGCILYDIFVDIGCDGSPIRRKDLGTRFYLFYPGVACRC